MSTSKQLLPIYDKSIIYVPVSLLIPTNIRKIAIIITRFGFYLQEEILNVIWIGRGHAWLDIGTHANLQNTRNFVRPLQEGQRIRAIAPHSIDNKNTQIRTKMLTKNTNGTCHLPLLSRTEGKYE
ncbi:MAG: hypothetical protein JKY94_10905 [Rhodobacteraceae bacterium]|nr:hypothetical protein [Paracoccaceae bacterium]